MNTDIFNPEFTNILSFVKRKYVMDKGLQFTASRVKIQ